MDETLAKMLERARGVKMSEAALEEHRISLAAANGYLSDSRVTVDAVRATRNAMAAGSGPKKD